MLLGVRGTCMNNLPKVVTWQWNDQTFELLVQCSKPLQYQATQAGPLKTAENIIEAKSKPKPTVTRNNRSYACATYHHVELWYTIQHRQHNSFSSCPPHLLIVMCAICIGDCIHQECSCSLVAAQVKSTAWQCYKYTPQKIVILQSHNFSQIHQLIAKSSVYRKISIKHTHFETISRITLLLSL